MFLYFTFFAISLGMPQVLTNQIFSTFFYKVKKEDSKLLTADELRVLFRIYRRTKNQEVFQFTQKALSNSIQNHAECSFVIAYLEAFQLTHELKYKNLIQTILDHELQKPLTALDPNVISALAKSGRLFHVLRYINAAQKIALLAPNVDGLIELYEATFDSKWLIKARSLQEMQNESQVSALNSLRLSDFFVDQTMRKKTSEWLQTHSQEATALIALDYVLDRSKAVAIIGSSQSSFIQKTLEVITQEFNPNFVIAVGSENNTEIPLLKNRFQINHKLTIYICEHHICKIPTTDLQIAKKLVHEYEPYILN